MRKGVLPFRIEILTTIDVVAFDDCYSKRFEVMIDGIETNLIDLAQLKVNKKASGRSKDITDLENLP